MNHTYLTPGSAQGSQKQEYFNLVDSRDYEGVPVNKPWSAKCKASALPSVLLLCLNGGGHCMLGIMLVKEKVTG